MDNSPELDLDEGTMGRMRADLLKMKKAGHTPDEAKTMLLKRYGLANQEPVSQPDPMSQDVTTPPPPVDPSAPLPASTPGEVFSNYIGGPIHDKLDIFLQQSLPGLPPMLRDMITSTAAPDTLTQAGIAAGTMLAPGAGAAAGTAARNVRMAVPMLQRMLGPAVGGALGGYLEKMNSSDAALGGAMGAGLGALAEAGSAASKYVAKSKLARIFAKSDPEALMGAINETVQTFPKMQTAEEFGSAVHGTIAQNRMSGALRDSFKDIGDALKVAAPLGTDGFEVKAASALGGDTAKILPGGRITSPVLRQMLKEKIVGGSTDGKPGMSFDQLTDEIASFRMKGRSAGGDPAKTASAADARDNAFKLSQVAVDALGTVDPKLSQQFGEANALYHKGAQMLRLLRQPGVMDDNGNLNMLMLQKAFKEKQRAGLERAFPPGDLNKLKDAIFRGADNTQVVDIIRKSGDAHTGVGLGMSGKPHIFTRVLSKLLPNEYAGDYDLPFPYFQPKTGAAMAYVPGAPVANTLAQKPNLSAADEE